MKQTQKRNTKAGGRALRIVQRFHPGVTRVVDSQKDLIVEVTHEDDVTSKVKSHNGCAMANACKRHEHADGVIVSVRSAYVVKGDTAIRYRVPESVSREVVSFDRKGGFNPGLYKLNAPSKWEALGHKLSGEHTGEEPRRTPPRFRHKTENIRTSLQGA